MDRTTERLVSSPEYVSVVADSSTSFTTGGSATIRLIVSIDGKALHLMRRYEGI